MFRNRIDNLITTTPTSDRVFFRNLARAGFEETELEPGYETDRFFGRIARSTLRGRDRDFGYTLAPTPADTPALTLGGRLPEREIGFGWRGAFADAITTATRNVTTGAITETRFAGYATHDLFVSWTPQTGALAGFDVQVWVENLFDTAYRNNLSLDEGRGRTFKLSLTRAPVW